MRIPSLDGLRAISIAFVLLAHLSGTRNFGSSDYFGVYGNFGVRVFFVISGFLITTLLMKERTDTGTISLKDFYVRRAFRIFPAAYTFILVALVTHWNVLSWTDVVTAVTYTSNHHPDGHWITGHLWSLSVEEQFYLIWPLAFLLFYRVRLPILLTVVALGPVFRVAFWLMWGYKALTYPFPVVMDALAMGCLLAVLRPRLDAYAHWLTSPWFVLVPAGTILMPVLRLSYNNIYESVGLTVMQAGIALCIDNAIRKEYRLLNLRPIVWMGALSYSLYLWQQPFLDRQASGLFTTFPVNLVMAFVLACASYYGVERPCLALRLRLHGRTLFTPRARATQAAAPSPMHP